MSKFHAAVNHVADNNVLVRIKELGDKAPTLKLDKSYFGDTPAVKHEGFVVELEGLMQKGNYLICSNAKIVTRENAEAKPFDVNEYMASLSQKDSPIVEIVNEKDCPF